MRRAAGLNVASVAVQVGAMVKLLVKASNNPGAIDPNRYVPDGILGSKTFDGLALPADPAAMVDLSVLGLPGQMRADELGAMQKASRAAHSWYAQRDGESRTWRPTLKAVREQGLLTETHFIRFAQLSAAATQRVSMADIAHQVQATGAVRQSEGVLIGLSDQPGRATATIVPLRIDGRTGAIQAFGAQVRLGPTPTVGPAPVLRPRTAARPITTVRAAAMGPVFGVVVHQQVGQFGNAAVFGTLPVNTLALAGSAQPVAIGSAVNSELAGLFSGREHSALPPGLVTITVPAPLRDAVTRVATAIGEAHGARVAVAFTDLLPAVVNTPDETARIRAAVAARAGEAAVLDLVLPSMGGEDFAWYLDHVPGAMARLGVRPPGQARPHDLHQGSFDVDEAALPVAVRPSVGSGASTAAVLGCRGRLLRLTRAWLGRLLTSGGRRGAGNRTLAGEIRNSRVALLFHKTTPFAMWRPGGHPGIKSVPTKGSQGYVRDCVGDL